MKNNSPSAAPLPETPSWELPNAERRQIFHRHKINHLHLVTAFQSIVRIINSEGGRLGIGVGSTGVGKTTLLGSLQRRIEKSMLMELQSNEGTLPSVIVSACTPETGTFNWKLMYLRILEGCREVAVGKKVPLELLDGRPLYRQISSGESTTALRETVGEVLRQRRPRALFIDEGQHILKTGSTNALSTQLDTLKQLADECGIPIFLFGTYDLVVQYALNAQLARRTVPIHLRRYRTSEADEYREFASIVVNLTQAMPMKIKPNLIPHVDFLMERSLGCIGILKELLMRALNLAIEETADTVTIKHLKASAMSANKCMAILDEIEAGEALFNEASATIKKLRARMGLDDEPPAASMAKLPKGPKPRPGVRAPFRDPIGNRNGLAA